MHFCGYGQQLTTESWWKDRNKLKLNCNESVNYSLLSVYCQFTSGVNWVFHTVLGPQLTQVKWIPMGQDVYPFTTAISWQSRVESSITIWHLGAKQQNSFMSKTTYLTVIIVWDRLKNERNTKRNKQNLSDWYRSFFFKKLI